MGGATTGQEKSLRERTGGERTAEGLEGASRGAAQMKSGPWGKYFRGQQHRGVMEMTKAPWTEPHRVLGAWTRAFCCSKGRAEA